MFNEERIMLNLFTIGYTKKSAEKFFGIISENKIEIVADVRLYNSTQLAGFSKSADLQYFLKKICNCKYVAESLTFWKLQKRQYFLGWIQKNL